MSDIHEHGPQPPAAPKRATIELLEAGIKHLERAKHAWVATEEEWGTVMQWLQDARAAVKGAGR